jgi:hypothetical protein
VKKREISAAARKRKSPPTTAALRSNGERSGIADADRKASALKTIGAAQPGSRDSRIVTYVVRDSFTMPVADYELIGALKSKCIALGLAVKKSELLRAGLHALTQISDENLARVVSAVERVKTGRPKGKKKRKKTNRAKGQKAVIRVALTKRVGGAK